MDVLTPSISETYEILKIFTYQIRNINRTLTTYQLNELRFGYRHIMTRNGLIFMITNDFKKKNGYRSFKMMDNRCATIVIVTQYDKRCCWMLCCLLFFVIVMLFIFVLIT